MKRSKHTNEFEHMSAIGDDKVGLLARSLLDLMATHDSPVEPIDGNTLRCWAVPISKEFSKSKTNLLLRRMRFSSGCNVHVDSDLVYTGGEASLIAALAGPCHKNWRKLRLPPLRGSFNEVLIKTLGLLGSPLAPEAATTLADMRDPKANSDELGPVLRSAGQFLSHRQLAEAADVMVRPGLAEQVAKPCIRPRLIQRCGWQIEHNITILQRLSAFCRPPSRRPFGKTQSRSVPMKCSRDVISANSLVNRRNNYVGTQKTAASVAIVGRRPYRPFWRW